jgi:hypothetical protein
MENMFPNLAEIFDTVLLWLQNKNKKEKET